MDKENAMLSAEELDLDIEFDVDNLFSTFEEEENQLESKLTELREGYELLEEERKQIGNPDSLGKVVLDEVYKQFANQIGLEMTGETLIQKYDREHPDESPVYNEKEGAKILQDKKYKDTREEMKRQQEQGILKDGYTGKDLKPEDSFDVEHVVKRKEIFEKTRRKQAGLEASELANMDENMTAVNDSLNRSIKEKSNKEYVAQREQREKDLIDQNERAKKKIDESNMSQAEKKLAKEEADRRLQNKLDADDELMLEADEKARKAINKEIRKEGTKQVAKKAGADALKTMAVTALFDFAKEVMNALVRFFKEKHKSFKLFLEEMKKALTHMLEKIKSYLKQGASMFLGSIISEIFGPIVSTFKKLASMIKQGVTTLIDSVKFLLDKNNKNMPLSEKIAHVGKIIIGGAVGFGALGLGTVFTNLLEKVPIFLTPIPLMEMSIGGLIGGFLASLICGLIGAIALNTIDKWIANRQKSQNTISKIEQNNKILDTQNQLVELQFEKLDVTKCVVAKGIMERHSEFAQDNSDIDDILNEETSNEKSDADYNELQNLLEIL